MSWGAETGDAFDVVLVGDAMGEMATAVALAGGRVVEQAGWSAPLDLDAGALLVIDLGGAGAADDRLAELATRADIVCCDWNQLDAVAGAVLLTDAQLLCAPSPADRIEALVIAAAELARAPDAVREGEGVRLRRFSAEVGRIAATLAGLAAAEGGDVADRRPAYDAGPSIGGPTVDAAEVRRAIRARQLRASVFGDGLFEDPAWDMLLDLFAAELEASPVSVSSLCIAAAVAPTTALRWIGRLIDAGLFERRADARDRRRAFVALTPRGSAAMRGYVAALARAGLTLG